MCDKHFLQAYSLVTNQVPEIWVLGFGKLQRLASLTWRLLIFTTIFINDFPKLREPASYIADNLKNLPKCWQKMKTSHVYLAILKKTYCFCWVIIPQLLILGNQIRHFYNIQQLVGKHGQAGVLYGNARHANTKLHNNRPLFNRERTHTRINPNSLALNGRTIR